MQNVLKQFGVKDTDSFDSRFRWSIIKLTAQYAGALALILIISSAISYAAFSQRLHNRFRRTITIEIIPDAPRPPVPSEDDVRQDLIEAEILVNGILLLLGVMLSYLLAEKTLEPIRSAYKRQQQFVSDASHELRTPLSILQVELENEIAVTNAPEAISKLEEVRHMSKIVNDLLLLSRLDEAKQEHPLSNFDVVPVIRSVVDRLQPMAQAQHVSLSFDALQESLVIKGNEELLTHALMNIVKNAVTYNRENGSVIVSVKKEKQHALISVKDTGKGISAADLVHIFDRFYRIEESRSRASGGTGLGLSIAQSSIQKMGGSIAIESVVDEGTEVIVTL